VYAATAGSTALKIGGFLAAMLVTAQFSFVGNYLPRLFPTALRGTGESVAIKVVLRRTRVRLASGCSQRRDLRDVFTRYGCVTVITTFPFLCPFST
jgi:hypothetical protein